MNDEFPPSLALLARTLAADVNKRYRIGIDGALSAISEIWADDNALIKTAASESNPERLKRTRVYKQAASSAKKTIYYSLRRYKSSESVFENAVTDINDCTDSEAMANVLRPVLEAHVSSGERLDHAGVFADELIAGIAGARTVLDIGCGVMPLMFPFEKEGISVNRYLALDRDKKAVDVLRAFSDKRANTILAAHTWDLAQGWGALDTTLKGTIFDIALMLKLVPVVQRQNPELLDTLAAVPAKKVIVTGSKYSMVKRVSIGKREMAILYKFARNYGFGKAGRFETPDEIGLVLEKETQAF